MDLVTQNMVNVLYWWTNKYNHSWKCPSLKLHVFSQLTLLLYIIQTKHVDSMFVVDHAHLCPLC